MPAWYDIRSLSFDCEEDGPGIKSKLYILLFKSLNLIITASTFHSFNI